MNMLKKKLDKMNRSQLRYICMRVFEQIDFTKLKTEKDMVNFLLKPLENKYKMISRYDKQTPLGKFTQIKLNDDGKTEYTFIEDGKNYIINVSETGTNVLAILDIDTTKSLQLEYIKNEKQIKMKFVPIKTGGVCTRSVAYTMKALLNYIEKLRPYIIYGNVHIKSENPVKAFNCFYRAFILNGFALDKDEFKSFLTYLKTVGNSNTEVDFTFNYFNKIRQVTEREMLHLRPFWMGLREPKNKK
ncbi:MAG: hypothetical protein HN879_09775 [Flavobacteriaceae bacterium]|nr:hypothetical protein [Flavobacteriaceae bacterium]